ncbi:MAG: metalloregulator ArsR/SmtB family transcription factor [Pseudomonadota bacterium]
MDDFMAVTKALADENRVRTLLALENGELCVCQIIDFLELAPSTVSRHMGVLRQAGLVKARKQGRWMFYRLPGPDAPAWITAAIFWLGNALQDNPSTRRDRERIIEIIENHVEDRCRTLKR